MPRLFSILEKDESILWEGKPDYRPRRILLTIAGIGLLSLTIAFLGLRGVQYAENGQLIPAILLIANLSIVLGYQGTSYYITSRRILKLRNLVLVRRRREMSLEAITDMTVTRRSKRGFLKFRTSTGRTINFSLLRDDPDNIRQIAIDAKATVTSSGP